MQDSPAVKMTYEAHIRVESQFVVKMSANETKVKDLNQTHKQYSFESKIKIPSYLIAMAIGDLEYKSLGKRVGVVSEPGLIAAAAEEFRDIEQSLVRAE